MPYPYTVRFPYALELSAITGTSGMTKTYGFVAEIDAELVVEYTSPEDWEITGLRFEQTKWNPEYEITHETDPDMWKVISRSLDLNDKDIATRVVEQILEDYTSRREERADQAYEDYRERMWEAGR